MMTKTIAMLSNVTMDILAQALPYDVYLPDGYDTWQHDVLDETSAFNMRDFYAVIVILYCKDVKKNWHTYSEGEDRLNEWLELLKFAAEHRPATHFFIANLDIAVDVLRPACEPQPERAWEYYWQSRVCDLSHEYSNIYMLDMKSLVEEYGRAMFYSPKMWYAGGMPYSLRGIKALAEEIALLLTHERKKVLITDLDNTLWGGVVGEGDIVLSEYLEGARFRDFQLRLKELSQTGALLAIASKNNEDDACAVIDGHPHMALRSEDFATAKINWESKADNIRALAKELNLGLDSMVFIDDNPMERELVKQELPEVVVLDFPTDTTMLEKTAIEAYRRHFRILRATDEDRKKTHIYRQETERKRLCASSATPKDYLKALDMEVDMRQMSVQETERVVQLCNKTNQFNLTTKRYDHQGILALAAGAGCKLLTVRCRDKYGDNGLVGVIILKESGRRVEIDNFLLSCRVMGRQLEDYAFKAFAEYYKGLGFEGIDATFVSTAKNKPVERLYDRLGFDVISRSPERTEYSFDLAKRIEIEYIYKFTAEMGEKNGN